MRLRYGFEIKLEKKGKWLKLLLLKERHECGCPGFRPSNFGLFFATTKSCIFPASTIETQFLWCIRTLPARVEQIGSQKQIVKTICAFNLCGSRSEDVKKSQQKKSAKSFANQSAKRQGFMCATTRKRSSFFFCCPVFSSQEMMSIASLCSCWTRGALERIWNSAVSFSRQFHVICLLCAASYRNKKYKNRRGTCQDQRWQYEGLVAYCCVFLCTRRHFPFHFGGTNEGERERHSYTPSTTKHTETTVNWNAAAARIRVTMPTIACCTLRIHSSVRGLTFSPQQLLLLTHKSFKPANTNPGSIVSISYRRRGICSPKIVAPKINSSRYHSNQFPLICNINPLRRNRRCGEKS